MANFLAIAVPARRAARGVRTRGETSRQPGRRREAVETADAQPLRERLRALAVATGRPG
jgi:hypothetical protein